MDSCLKMPTSMLFAINNEGRVFGLATNSSKWREFPYLGLDFKHLSAVPHFLWAVGGDRQIYVHVHGLDIPIRIKEESYENQRWLPLDGFSKRLLPTDRFNFSSEDGLTERCMERIRLPSMAWQWEGNWHIETSLEGQQLDDDGWTYAVDFPATYHPQKQWSSCVRRRKWVRYRRYSAMNSWCAIAPLHKDPTKEPFIDVCVGGQSVPGSVAGSMQVWAVTAHGRVMWRAGVSVTSPEGIRWSSVPVPQGSEVKSISCGPTGIVWALLWSGRVLVRTGITGGRPTGESWTDVAPPEDKLKLAWVSVGSSAVWAVTNDRRVWFRRGVRSLAAGGQTSNSQDGVDESPCGSGWVEMVGEMSMVSVAPNNQVWGVHSEDRLIHFRTGVSAAELTGKRWRVMQALTCSSRASSTASVWSTASSQHKQRPKHRSTNSLEHKPRLNDGDWSADETSRSAPTSLNIKPIWAGPGRHHKDADSERGSVEGPALITSQDRMADLDEEGEDNQEPQPQQRTSRSLTAWSPVRSVGSLVGMEADPNTDPGSALDLDAERAVFRERDDPADGECYNAQPLLWSCVEAGAVTIDPSFPPNWFLDGSSSSLAESNSKSMWRNKILEELKDRRIIETRGYESYEVVSKVSSCVKSIECKVSLPGSSTIEECVLELEWTSNEADEIESGTLSVISIDLKHTKSQLSIREITAIMNASEPGSPRLAIHTIRSTTRKVSPLKLHFSGDVELDDWTANLTSVCCQHNKLIGAPAQGSLWATSKLGEVFNFDSSTYQESQRSGEEEDFCEEHSVRSLPTSAEALISWQLVNGFTPGSRLCLTGIVDEKADRFQVDFRCEQVGKEDEIALHFNPRLGDEVIVRNTKTDGAWGHEEREGGCPLSRGGTYVLDIYCWEEAFKVMINGTVFTHYEHRLKPHLITHLTVNGSTEIDTAMYYSKRVILPLKEMFWRQMGGHLQIVETCNKGVTWGISFDNTPWVYTSGWGGTFLSGHEQSVDNIHAMTDSRYFYVYENQRWNPLSGFTTHGLPTDRPMWSDSTGRKKRSKDTAKLLSKHWTWLTDWAVDYHISGGVDKEGWQYAVDFPASYHGKKQFTDYVRRRRWLRVARLNVSGPWQEIGNTKLVDVSLQSTNSLETICVWAVGLNGDALFRKGVTKSCPAGVTWEHVPCNQTLCSISCGHGSQVWAVAKDGSIYWRFGITTSNPIGEVWETVEPPSGSTISRVSVGKHAVWALDTDSRLYIRTDVTPVFPEGTRWEVISDKSTDCGFKHVSASGGEVWAIDCTGTVCRRSAVTDENPAGTCWLSGLPGNWLHISARGCLDSSSKQRMDHL
ncbi:tectonin beta-propeller repeat-containing protein [Nilaparvata lugens]|uniref:tectonin beta-propeller repeat-containing protein n=1 Tax=Nilaparvata lugens TaxID=108931 RepID=UPI00193DE1DE|nr:tectonin beta-propeller repeat-containing protein [Nilaparvata lugens]